MPRKVKAQIEQHIQSRVLTAAIWKKQSTQAEQHIDIRARTNDCNMDVFMLQKITVA